MTVAPTCPQCSGALRAPGLMSSDWVCDQHGAVAPYHRAVMPLSAEALAQGAARSGVPLWSPLPLLPGWSVSGFGWCGDERRPASAVALALMGPSPLGGPADLVLIAEEPGSGLGGRIAGFEGSDPGACVVDAPDAKIIVAGHPTALWRCQGAADRMAFVGEALGVWLWAVLWPPAAELVLLEHVELHDLRHEAHAELALPIGAASTRLP